MESLRERLERLEGVERRIEELEVEITEHEREDNKRNYKFYVDGSELYKELAILKAELLIGRRYISKFDGE